MKNMLEKFSTGDEKLHDYNPLTLAYIGDAVFELAVRTALVKKRKLSPGEYFTESIKYVSAAAQAEILEKVRPMLTEEEKYYVKRGRNAKTSRVAKNADPVDYRKATALETLIGALYLTGYHERIEEIMKAAMDD